MGQAEAQLALFRLTGILEADNLPYAIIGAFALNEDLVDVQELIKSAGLTPDVSRERHPWVRDKYLQLWQLAQTADPF